MKWKNALALVAILSQSTLTPLAMARSGFQQSSGTVTGFVVPTNVGANEPFTFAAQGSVEGEVISVQTVDGEVVAKKKTDKFGRVFIAAGLAAGLYLLSRDGRSGSGKQTPIEVNPMELPTQGSGMNIGNQADFINLKDGLNLKGSGFAGNAADLSIAAGNIEIPVLASTPRELRTGPISNLKPGTFDLNVKNLKSGEATKVEECTAYTLQTKLTQEKVGNGQMTMLEFQMNPNTLEADLNVKITNGPVHFQGDKKEMEVQVRNGLARIPILADAVGSGPFNIGWTMSKIWMAPPPGGQPIGQNNRKKKPCPVSEHIAKSTGGWDSEDVRVQDPVTKKWKMEYRLRRVLICMFHSGCSLQEGHAGAHDYKAIKRCDQREPFTDSNSNGTWDENDGPWDKEKDDANGNGKPDPGEYTDKDGNGKYDPPEKFEDKNKDKKWHGDPAEEHSFDTKADREKYAKEHP